MRKGKGSFCVTFFSYAGKLRQDILRCISAAHRYEPHTAAAAIVASVMFVLSTIAMSGCTPGKLSHGEKAVVLQKDEVAGPLQGQVQRQPVKLQKPSHCSTPKAPPLVHVTDAEAEHDFGYVESSSKHRVAFVVSNRGDKPLKILKTRSECRCLSIAEYPGTIRPKGAGKFDVTFVAPKESRAYAMRVVLLTDDPKRKMISLKIKANVGRPLEVVPKTLDLGKLPAGKQHTAEVKLINRSEKPFRSLYSTCSAPGCVAQIPRKPIPPRGELSIPVIVRTGQKPGKRKGTLYIHTNNANQPRLSVRVEYEVVPNRASTKRESANKEGGS